MTNPVWWNHRTVGRRLKAWPVNAKGWAALAGLVLTGVAIPGVGALAFGKTGAVLGTPLGMIAVFGGTYWVLFNRSRRAN